MFGKAKKDYNQIYETEHKIVQTLGEDYLCICSINAATESFQIYSVKEDVVDRIKHYSVGCENYNQLIDLYVKQLVYVEDKHAVENALALSNILEELKTNNRLDMIARLLHSDGRLRYVKHEVRRLQGEVGNQFILAIKDVDAEVTQDLMRQEQLRKAYLTAERASLAKNEFMHNMSHDIRTPLNAIVGYTTVASDCVDDPKSIIKYLEKIDIASQHLLHIINEILDLGEIEEGNIRLTDSTLTMRELLDQVLDTAKPLVSDKQITLIVDNKDEENKQLVFDAFHLSRILNNLLSNATKFSDNGSEIKLSVIPSEGSTPNKKHYRFEVEDHGIGMSEEFMTKMFDPFERERTSTQSRKNGVGIGLSIVKNVIDAMGGAVYAKSTKGVGTTFTVELELDIAPKSEVEKTKKIEETKANLIKGKRILVVDDSKVNRDIAMAILESFEAEAECASDGDVAVEMVAQSEPGYYDLILMDIQMPKMDGHEATKQIRSLDRNDTKNVPIVALTADVFDDTRKKAESVGMDGFLTKPINVKSLRQTLEEKFVI